MGHKINPLSFRLGVKRAWNSFWFGGVDYSLLLNEDLQIRHYIDNICNKSKISRGAPLIKRWLNSKTQISLSLYNPPIDETQTQISFKNVNNLQLINSIKKLTGNSRTNVFSIPIKYKGSFFFFTIPITNAQLVAHYIAYELEKRNPFNEVIQDLMDWIYESKNLLGLHISCSGRFMGEDRSRTLWKKHGKMPYSTLDAHIDYATSTAISKYGCIGIKVWIYFDSK